MVRVNVGGGGRRRFDAIGVDGVAELLTWFEERDPLGWDVDLFAGLGIASDAGISLAGSEAAETTDLDLISGLQRSDDGLEEGVDDNFTVAACEVA